MVKIAVIGAGVNGLTCALKIKEKYSDFDVTIFSEEFTPNTTGDGSGGLWYPYLCGSTSQEKLTKWGSETYQFLHDLWYTGGYHISLMPMYELYRDKREVLRPRWADLVFGYRELDMRQLDHLSRMHSVNYAAGRSFTTFVIQAPKLLEYLYKRYKAANGKIVKAKISSLSDSLLSGYHVVVNCTGVGARHLVPDDRVFPIRGQIAKVKAPWLNYTIVDEDSGHYVIPNDALCVLGGTHQEHDYRRELDDENKDFIINGCKQMIPGLKYAELIQHWVGLRPGRDEVRLEIEVREGKVYIHNYGHGGSGLTLFWGCADSVLQLLTVSLKSIKPSDFKSKI
ncbi:PREDICTED: D-amino-acid oxidase [Papilio polytes]|uniref:D-amino-acid oxidase n=1 Tax=Papilio polytes TaxID=76194 RepID=UPI0006763A26|nr:PREDICTED: D-amino-acid oxidase [Papilio polytes]